MNLNGALLTENKICQKKKKNKIQATRNLLIRICRWEKWRNIQIIQAQLDVPFGSVSRSVFDCAFRYRMRMFITV